MKTRPIFLVLIGALVMFAILWLIGKYLRAGYKIGLASQIDPTASYVPKLPMPTRLELLAKGYNDEEVADIMASDSYKNGTGSW